MVTIKTTAKTEQQIEDLKSIITVELTGTEKQISYAMDILSRAINGAVNANIATVGRGKNIVIEIDDKIVSAINMNSDAAKIISGISQFDWATKKSIYSLVKVVVEK